MKLKIFPRTQMGRWSLGALFAFFLLFQTRMFIKFNYGTGGGSTFFSNMPLAILLICAWIMGSLSFITGVSFFKKETSLVVFFCVLFGLFIFAFGIGEVLVPH